MGYRRSGPRIASFIMDLFGVVFLLITLGAIFVVISLIWNIGDPDTGFAFGPYELRSQNARFLKISGIILFGLFALVGWGAANMLLDNPVARFRRWRRLRRGDESS
jgi:hypothetical protein